VAAPDQTSQKGRRGFTVGKKPVTRAVLFGALCLPILPALAQEGGGILFTFGIDERFEAGDNLSLEIPSEGSTLRADTRLSFGILSETATDRLSVNLSGLYRAEDTGGSNTSGGSGFQDPNLKLSYTREGAASDFTATAFYRESDVDDLRSLSDFITQDGTVLLPGDIGNLAGSGTRETLGGNVKLDLWRDAPIGFVLGAGYSQTSYSNISPLSDLTDSDRWNVDGQVRLRFSTVSTGTIGLRHDVYDTASLTGRDRRTTALDLGLEQTLSPRALLTASIGYSEVERENPSSSETGLIGSLGLDYDMANGSATADFSAELDETGGRRIEFTLGRSLDLRNGALTASIGVTAPENGSTGLIGSLDWQQALPTGQISARIDRSISSSDEDVSRLTTLASVNYDHEINAVSGLEFGVLYVSQEGVSGSTGVTRTDLSAAYRRSLTKDWDLNTGINYRVRDEDAQGRAEAPSVFLSLGRRFEFRP
jgi:hypothetical protein